ncbi:Lysophospholipid acyltransferase [Phytophthora cinnamomi]|uniref:Lysophospholipid acyltransferase n=1 Tax=Phytophthora cinnamomi TaxID=4785 RepID=UPI003559AFDF|nr:Lysophospholipid acyltransferase [Phytophthora cinnamomi]
MRSDAEAIPQPQPLLLDVELVRAVRRALGRAPRPADYVEALQAFAEPLAAIPLPVRCDVDTAQAFRDATREEIVLNGVRFVGDHRTEAFVAAVKRIVGVHVGGDEHPELALLVADRVMRGCSRTLSGADSFFAVHELLASPELLIKPRAGGSVPLDVTLGRDCTDHRFKCRIKSVNLFGLYANEDIELLLRSARRELDAPLVAVDTIVVEHIDISADKSSRRLTIRSPDASKAPTKLDLEVRELF